MSAPSDAQRLARIRAAVGTLDGDEWLQRLDDWGLIARERRSRANGARASDRITLNLGVMVRDGAERCREVKDQDEAANPSLPAESAGRTYRQPDAEPTGNEAQPTGNQFRAYKDEPSIEPLNGASQPRASARESGEDRTEERSESREALERRFWKMARGHPQSAGMPKQSWLAEWLKLDPDARDRAERRYPAWLALLKAQDKRHVPVLSTYFAQALFEEVPEPRGDTAPTSVEARPFGPIWNAICLRDLVLQTPQAPSAPPSAYIRDLLSRDDETGRRERLKRQAEYGWPRVTGWYQQAASRKGFTAKVEDAWLATLMEPVPVGSNVMADWRAEYARRGWPWLPGMPGSSRWHAGRRDGRRETRPNAGGTCSPPRTAPKRMWKTPKRMWKTSCRAPALRHGCRSGRCRASVAAAARWPNVTPSWRPLSLNPKLEAEADEIDIRNRVKTRQQVMTERTGGDFDQKIEQGKREQAAIDEAFGPAQPAPGQASGPEDKADPRQDTEDEEP